MDNEKRIDESWKESVDHEKKVEPHEHSGSESPQSESLEGTSLPDINFLSYVTSLAFQTVIFLGEAPNPLTNKAEKNLPQAKFIIDTLVMLREKTKGNLTEEEDATLEAYLYELQMKYVEIVNGGSPSPQA